MRTLIRDLREHVDETVTVYGWVNTLRLQRRIQFVLVRDHTGVVQVTHLRCGEGDLIESTFENVTLESAVKVTGKVVDNAHVKLGGLVWVVFFAAWRSLPVLIFAGECPYGAGTSTAG